MTNSTSSSSTLPAQISAHLATTLSVTPSSTWLAGFLSTQKPTTPLSSLLATARHRLLHSDIIASLAPAASTTFPVDVHDAERRERRLPGPLAVQVLVADNLSQSRWTQIEALEARERGEGTRGREVVRAVPAAEDGEPDPVGAGGEGGTCRLLLQDAKGVKVWGLELKSVQGVKVGMGIGSKMVLRDVMVARGVLLLEPHSTTLLGGKVESLHKAWADNRKAELKAAIGIEES